MKRLIEYGRFHWRLHWREPLESVNQDMRTFLADHRAIIDAKTVWVLLSATVALALHEYTRQPSDFSRLVAWMHHLGWHQAADRFDAWLDGWEANRIRMLSWWVYSTMVAYIVIPILVIKCILKEKLSDYGSKLKTAFRAWPVYLIMAAFMFPIVYAASFDPAFLRKYPFYPLMPGESIPADFLLWELLYACQFVGLEFFFRGFLVHGLKHRFGCAAVLVMTMPYCMIHFGKPMPETFAAILAGMALGVMSLKSGSCWMGAALHICVAWSMDFLALWRKGFLG